VLKYASAEVVVALKSIIVVASGEREDAETITAAAKLAARLKAHVRVVPAFPDPAADLIYFGTALRTSPEAAERIEASEREAQARVEAAAKQAAAGEGLSADPQASAPSIIVDKRPLQPAVALARAAVLADLIVFGAAAARSPILAGLFAEMLLATRAPTLLLKGQPPSGGPVALAWDGSVQAGRAARAALPLLQAASGVLVLRNIDDETAEAAPGDMERLETYLAQHGVANIAKREIRGANVAASLLEAAKADKCELLVAGAYGRPRLFEMVLGGTTRTLVNDEAGPSLLFAH
jgi:nucleotide-binding universal stress UspA family protein